MGQCFRNVPPNTLLLERWAWQPDDRTTLLLGTQRALVGAVGGSLYGACADLQGDLVVLTWYVAPNIARDEREDLQIAGTDVIADFDSGARLDERFVEVADPAQPLPTVGEWVFLRRGHTSA